jgi:hypothetical protein
MATSTKYPGTVNNNGWTNPNNVKVDDGSNATVAVVVGPSSGALQCVNLGFEIPVGATITGMLVEVEGSATAGGTLILAAMVIGGVEQGFFDDTISLTGSTALHASDEPSSALPTVAQANGATFGVNIYGNAPENDATISLDFVRVTLTYSLPGIGSANFNRFLVPGAR